MATVAEPVPQSTSAVRTLKAPALHALHSVADQISDRLPTVSASEALASLKAQRLLAIPTTLPRLDALLCLHARGSGDSPSAKGGLTRGQVTEIYGPPGVGKTTFALQVCASAIHQGGKAVWIDTTAPVVRSRLDSFLCSRLSDRGGNNLDDMRRSFHHFTAPSLPHLLALFVHSVDSFPPKGTSIIVVDSVSSPFEVAYHRVGRPPQNHETARWASGRRFAVMSELMSKLGKVAALHKLAVLLINQTSTRLRQGAPAVLVRAVSGSEWDTGISTQLCLFRDFLPPGLRQSQEDAVQSAAIRYVGVIKAGGVGQMAQYEAGFEQIYPFTIEENGLVELNVEPDALPTTVLASPARKQKRSGEVVEIDDSDAADVGTDENYGWSDDEVAAAEAVDDALASQPFASE